MEYKEIFTELPNDALFDAAEGFQAGLVVFGPAVKTSEDVRELVAVK
jgi:hypothetical protein